MVYDGDGLDAMSTSASAWLGTSFRSSRRFLNLSLRTPNGLSCDMLCRDCSSPKCCAIKYLNASPINVFYNQDVRVFLRCGSEEASQDAKFRSGSLYNLLGAGNVASFQERIALQVFPSTIRVVRPGENAPSHFLADQENLSMAFPEMFLEKVVIQIGADPITNLFHLVQIVVISALRCWNDSRRTRLSRTRRGNNVLDIAVEIGEDGRLRGSKMLVRFCCCGKPADLINLDSRPRRWSFRRRSRDCSSRRRTCVPEIDTGVREVRQRSRSTQ
jgi:hypothetical protein